MKILIIRSGPLDQFKQVLKEIKEGDENAKIYVLTHISTTTEILDIEPVWIYNYTSKQMGILRCGWECLRRLKDEKFDKIVLLYSNPLGDGFDNVRFLAFSIGAREFEAFNNQGEFIQIIPAESVITWAKEKLAFIYHGIIWLTLFIKDKIKKIRNANRR